MGNFHSPNSQKLKVIAENPSVEEVKGSENCSGPFSTVMKIVKDGEKKRNMAES